MADLQRPSEEIVKTSDVLYNYIVDLEAKAQSSWAGKHVALVALIAFAVGYVLG